MSACAWDFPPRPHPMTWHEYALRYGWVRSQTWLVIL